jgi:hypothetical protein
VVTLPEFSVSLPLAQAQWGRVELKAMNRFSIVFAVLALSFALNGCGRRSALDTPFTVEEATPGTPAAEAAANPPFGPNGRPVPPKTKPGPTPAARSFPLDPILN